MRPAFRKQRKTKAASSIRRRAADARLRDKDKAQMSGRFRREDGECVRKRKENKGGGGCVVGLRWNGHKCVPDGKGKKKTRNEFPPIEGQEDDGGFSCSHNDHMENGRCVPCRKGFHVEGDECVPD
jgi:hypothetical protein